MRPSVSPLYGPPTGVTLRVITTPRLGQPLSVQAPRRHQSATVVPSSRQRSHPSVPSSRQPPSVSRHKQRLHHHGWAIRLVASRITTAGLASVSQPLALPMPVFVQEPVRLHHHGWARASQPAASRCGHVKAAAIAAPGQPLHVARVSRVTSCTPRDSTRNHAARATPRDLLIDVQQSVT